MFDGSSRNSGTRTSSTALARSFRTQKHRETPYLFVKLLALRCVSGTPKAAPGPAGYTFGFQACRFKTFEENWCTPWANYTWKPPAASPQQGGASSGQQKAPDVVCGPDDESQTVPASQQCKAKPKPPVDCPPGGPQKQVPAGQTCPAPANAVTVSFQRSFPLWTVNVKNTAGIGGSCHYEAVDTVGGLEPTRTSTSNPMELPVSRNLHLCSRGRTPRRRRTPARTTGNRSRSATSEDHSVTGETPADARRARDNSRIRTAWGP